MKLPRDVEGAELVKALRSPGYEVTRQKGSHIRITTQEGGEHHEVIPAPSSDQAGDLGIHPEERGIAPSPDFAGVDPRNLGMKRRRP